VAVAAEGSLEERVERAVESAVAARRGELERLVGESVDAALEQLAGELVDAQLARRCANCGGTPLVARRTICRPCLRARRRELHAARVARRRNGTAPATSNGEEPHPARARESSNSGAGAQRDRHAPAHAGSAQAIAPEELARRARRHTVRGRELGAGELAAWLRAAGLAELTTSGMLVATAAGIEIGAGLAD
jgi:hypothetical protein